MILSKHRPLFELVIFEDQFAPAILAWAQDPTDALNWANLREAPRGASVFSVWHQEQGVRPYVLLENGVPVAYGEVWAESADNEIELGHIIVAPARRGHGLARLLVDHLLAAVKGSAPVAFLRVRPGNVAALACYRRAGFSTVSPAATSLYNSGQAVEYVWLSRQLPTA